MTDTAAHEPVDADTEPAVTLGFTRCADNHWHTVGFATEEQALAYIDAHAATHAVEELQDRPFDGNTFPRLNARLYPTCEHGLSASRPRDPQRNREES